MFFPSFLILLSCFFFFKQKTAYEMRISDWSSDVCSSDLPMSRALAREAATAEDRLRRDPELAAIFFKPDGTLLDEGENFRQVNLAAAIGQIRQKGGGALYVGPFAATLSDAAQSIGAPLTTEALRETVPSFRETLQVPVGNHLLHVAPPPATGGVVEEIGRGSCRASGGQHV